jgi:hypothetical protein
MNSSRTRQISKGEEPPNTKGYTENVPESFKITEFLDDRDDVRANDVRSHDHSGRGSVPVSILNLIGLIEVVSAVPTVVPKRFFEQVKIYSSGGTRRLYVYVTDSAGSGAWRYTALT